MSPGRRVPAGISVLLSPPSSSSLLLLLISPMFVFGLNLNGFKELEAVPRGVLSSFFVRTSKFCLRLAVLNFFSFLRLKCS